ncbi:hypothetical protein V1524DRAFT_450125 [Lipomyces starkeyi]
MEANKSMRLGKGAEHPSATAVEDSVPRPELSKLEKAIKPKSFSTKYPTRVSSKIFNGCYVFLFLTRHYGWSFGQQRFQRSSKHYRYHCRLLESFCWNCRTFLLSSLRYSWSPVFMRIGGFIYFIVAFIQANIQGFGVGFLSRTVPAIQSEIAAGHKRGLMGGIEFTFNIIGYATSCWVDYGFFFHLPSNMSWQGPYFVQCSIAFLLLSLSEIVLETPRYLAANDFPGEALQTLANLHGNGSIENEEVVAMNIEIQEAVLYERHLGSASWTEMFTIYRHRTFMAMTGQIFAQLNGINVISFYLASSLLNAGFSMEKSLLYAGYNSIIYIFPTLTTWYLADKWGCRPLLMSGSIAMAVSLSLVCMLTELASLSVLQRAYGIHMGPVPWLLRAEVIPLRARAKGMSLATIANCCFNFAIGMSSPAAFAKFHGYYYLIIVGFCLISLAMVKFRHIETARVTLEEIAIQFGDRAFEHEDRLELREIMDSHRPVENKV